MAEADGQSKKTASLAGVVVIIGLIIGLLLYYYGYGVITAVGVIITVIGIYGLISSFYRSDVPDSFGTSSSYAALSFGFLFLAIGCAVLVYGFTCNFIIAIVAFLVILVIYLLARRAK